MKFFVSCQNVSLEKHDNVCITKLYKCLIKTFLKTWLFLQKIQCFLFSAKELECGSTAEAPSWSGESDGMARQNQIAR